MILVRVSLDDLSFTAEIYWKSFYYFALRSPWSGNSSRIDWRVHAARNFSPLISSLFEPTLRNFAQMEKPRPRGELSFAENLCESTNSFRKHLSNDSYPKKMRERKLFLRQIIPSPTNGSLDVWLLDFLTSSYFPFSPFCTRLGTRRIKGKIARNERVKVHVILLIIVAIVKNVQRSFFTSRETVK